jgi:hypothetical protein
LQRALLNALPHWAHDNSFSTRDALLSATDRALHRLEQYSWARFVALNRVPHRAQRRSSPANFPDRAASMHFGEQ